MENPGREISLICFFLDDTIIITYERIGETVSKCLCIERDTMRIVIWYVMADWKIIMRQIGEGEFHAA